MDIQKKYFGTDGIRGKVGNAPISADWILKLGWAVGSVIREKYGGGKVLIGKDTRVSGYMFESALEAGLSAAGVDTLLLGPMPTPAISYLTRTLRAKVGIVISASHNPYYDNGFKFFASDGLKITDELEKEIEKYLDLEISTVESRKLGKATRINDAAGRYIEFCKSTLQGSLNLNEIKITVDCANGATYHIAPNVFHELGATVNAINTSPNGYNINDNCGAVYPKSLARQVVIDGSDIGVCIDGDGDRIILSDELGNILDGDDILYILAKHYKENNKLIGGVVGTIMSNLGLEKSLNKLGIKFIRTKKVGDKQVLHELKNRNWSLGGEQSGHVICMEHIEAGDSIIAALQVLNVMIATGKKLSELKAGFSRFPQKLVNLKIDNREIIQSEQIQSIIREVQENLNGRVLVRASGTEPVIRVMVEADDAARVQRDLDYIVDNILKISAC